MPLPHFMYHFIVNKLEIFYDYEQRTTKQIIPHTNGRRMPYVRTYWNVRELQIGNGESCISEG